MSHGLRCWDSTGRIVLDITDRITRLHGTYTVSFTYPTLSGFVSVSGMDPSNGWAIYAASTEILVWMVSGGFNWEAFDTTGPASVQVTVLRF